MFKLVCILLPLIIFDARGFSDDQRSEDTANNIIDIVGLQLLESRNTIRIHILYQLCYSTLQVKIFSDVSIDHPGEPT
ncbi:hypothetical protein BD769DRAFT_1460093 [Suillus cothurnatus]|nr:hypothetical protein BD769DRAFT_1460093 [Suillus cothurnatus]